MWTVFVIIPLVLWLFFGAGVAKGWLKFCVIIVLLSIMTTLAVVVLM